MAAPERNSNAQKWTIERVAGYLSQLEKATEDKKVLFLGQELVKLGLYKDIWRYWKQRFGHIDEMLDRMDLVEMGFESNLFNAALKGEIPARIAIICLRNAHKWCENPQHQNKAAHTIKTVAMPSYERYEENEYRQKRA
jgi:hypothetical protein